MLIDYFKRGRRWLALIPVALIVISVVLWWVTRDSLPPTLRVATAHQGGLYHEFGQALADSLEKRTGRPVEVITTEGSLENARLLKEGKVDLAILQGGSVPLKGLSALAPLYPEVVHVVTRADSSVRSLDDLASRRVLYGPEGSGMRTSAARIFGHYGLSEIIIAPNDRYFRDLWQDETIDAAIVTTGLMNPDLQEMLASGKYRLLPVEAAKAIAVKDPFFTVSSIPRGLYREGPPVPSEDAPTVSTTALLMVREEAGDLLVGAVMDAVYEGGLELQFASLIARDEAIGKSPVTLHPVSRRFLNPPDHLGRFSQVLDSLAAFKELSVALAAGLYLLWTRRKRFKQQRETEQIQRDKDRLDVFLEKTLEIERAQMATSDPALLEELLEKVTRIKLAALTRFTHEELRSDQAFSIFLLQCSNLISTLQMKILRTHRRE